jgi:hypothetical protein
VCFAGDNQTPKHRAGSIVRSQARRKRRPPTAYLAAGRRSTAELPWNAVSAGLIGHRRADRCGHLRRRRPEAEPPHAASIANSIVALRGRSSTAPLPSCRKRLSRHPRGAPINARAASHILVGLSSNALVHYVAGDRAPTCPVADRRKTKPSDREARVRRGDRDRPTPKGTAERSARA